MLQDAMRKQSERFGTQIITETVAKVDLSKRPFKFWPEYEEDKEPHTADAIIIATGASARRLGLKGEEQYWQNGISACAVCDGAVPIFRNKPLVVIGGGDSAAEEAMFLTKYGSHVTVLVRKDVLRASKTMAKRLLANKKVTVKFNYVGSEIKGDDKGLMSHMVIKKLLFLRDRLRLMRKAMSLPSLERVTPTLRVCLLLVMCRTRGIDKRSLVLVSL